MVDSAAVKQRLSELPPKTTPTTIVLSDEPLLMGKFPEHAEELDEAPPSPRPTSLVAIPTHRGRESTADSTDLEKLT